jgi:HEAT repeat protein
MRHVLRFCSFVIVLFSSCSTALINDQKTNDALIDRAAALMQSSRWTDRISAIELLSEQRNPRSETILAAAADDQHTRVRIEAAAALSNYSSQTSLIILHRMALDDSDSNVRLSSLKSLLVRHNAESASVFIQLFTDKEWLLRETAVLGFCGIVDHTVQMKYVNMIIDMLDDPSENVRIAILNNYRVHDTRIYQFIKKSLSNDSIIYRPSLLKALLHALLDYKMDPQTRLRVASFMTHANPDIRVMALHCINSSDSKE